MYDSFQSANVGKEKVKTQQKQSVVVITLQLG